MIKSDRHVNVDVVVVVFVNGIVCHFNRSNVVVVVVVFSD